MSAPASNSQQQQQTTPTMVALITGSATGIGANIAVDLASKGYSVVVTGRDLDRLNEVVQQCKEVSGLHSSSSSSPSSSSGETVAFVADLCDLEQVDRLIHFVRLKFNRLDVLVNNACWRADDHKSILDDGAFDDLRKVLHVNVSMPLYLIHKCLIPLKPVRSADDTPATVVINISSIASQQVVPLHLYSISKTCLSELSHQMSLLSQSLGILSVTISPGPVLTKERPHHIAMSNLTLMKRVGSTQEISNLVMFAIDKAHIFNGKELFADGGYLAKQKT